MHPQKEDPIRVRLTIWGNCIEYQVTLSTKTADLATFKIHINSVIFTRGAKYAGWNIGNYYLETPMGRSKYIIIHIRLIPPDIISHYNLNDLVDQDRWIYMEILRGYGLGPKLQRILQRYW